MTTSTSTSTPAPDNEAVTLTRRGPIAYVLLNRPQSINAISLDTRRLLPRAMDDANADPQVHVVVVHGAGDKGFCAGADIKAFAVPEPASSYRNTRVDNHWMAGFDRCRKPIIAAIHGVCFGGGVDIALACDLRVASEDALFALPETGHGVIGVTQRGIRMIGMAHTLDMALTGRRVPAHEAKTMGLVTQVVPRDQLMASVDKLAALIASKAPLATRFAKEAIRSGADLSYAAGNTLELDLMALLVNSEDRLEAGRAFAEKRAPVFKGC